MLAKTTKNKKNALPIDNKFIEFLSEDFRDTSTHLKETDRKIEFTFQLYAGGFALLASASITFLGTALGNDSWASEYNIYIPLSVGILLFIVWLFTKWAFSYSIKGTKMKLLYINRMNFLRKEIYEHLSIGSENISPFCYVSKLPPGGLQKVGMLDMFPLALQNILIYMPILICGSLYSFLNLFIQLNWIYILIATLLTALGIAKSIHRRLKRDWEKTVLETKNKIDELWKSPINS